MPRLSTSASSRKSSRQKDCLEPAEHRAGTVSNPFRLARKTSAASKSQRAARDLYPLPDIKRLSPSGHGPNRNSAVITPGSSVRKSVKRWDGIQRTTAVWDSLRWDPELWFPSGDCLIHFYEPGQSRRGASLRVSLADIESSGFQSFLDRYPPHLAKASPFSEALGSSSHGDSGRDSPPDMVYELHIPAPSHLRREEAFRYHVTTRNFFAWMYDLPVVGDQLGGALIALLERLNTFRQNKKQNEEDILAYLSGQDYLDFRECPDHSLAILNLAEACQRRDLWTDAFVHCAGMYDELTFSGEFESISHPTKALMLRAHLEMDLRLERAGRSISSFLEDDLSSAYLGLGKGAQAHLERFRCFLRSFYLGKYGYWPPAPAKKNSAAFEKSTYRTMYTDFRNLYQFLVDTGSTGSIQDNRLADGGICVLQNITSFDRRNKYASLPHPLPLIPDLHVTPSGPKSSGMRKVFAKRQTELDRRAIALTALTVATNTSSVAVMECPLVREYLSFERTWTLNESETISCSEARKVRWILIYAMLQTLISVTRAPREVHDTEGVSYPLCCHIADTPPWQKVGKEGLLDESGRPMTTKPPSHASSIEPDIDYLTSSRGSSIISADIPHPITVPRKVSVREDLTLRTPIPQKAASCGILIPGYGEPVQSSKAMSDPTTPDSSADGAASQGGWSSSSSEDGMDHMSVSGSETDPAVKIDTVKEGIDDLRQLRTLAKKISSTKFRSIAWESDVEQYLAC